MKRVLVVEDSRVAMELLVSALQGQDFAIEKYCDGESFLAAIAAGTRGDVVLLDVVLPGKDGFEICEKIRSDDNLADAHVVLMTGHITRETRIQAYRSGADGFLEKPIDPLEVREMVNSIIRQNRFGKLTAQKNKIERSLESLQQSYDETIAGWVRALDLRDNETEGHSRRVALLTAALAERLGIGGESLRQIWIGSLLHDIGKIGVPDSILHKPGILTGEEREVMKEHPSNALKLLQPIASLKEAMDIPYCHHEKYDGTGYPRGISGTDIPLSARMFCIGDVYDALRSERPYKESWSPSEALAEIASLSGSHFDPELVVQFCAMIEEHLAAEDVSSIAKVA